MGSAFQRGEFCSFRATNKIHLGKYETDIMMDDVFDYDGSTVRYAGTEYGVPQLRGLLGAWYVPVEDQTTRYKGKSADLDLSYATPEARERGDKFTMEKAVEDEAIVGTVVGQQQRREAAASGSTGPVDSDPSAADVGPDVEEVWSQAAPAQVSGKALSHVSITTNDAKRLAVADEINRRNIARMAQELDAVDPPKTRADMGGSRHDSLGDGGSPVGPGGKYRVVQDGGGTVVGKQYKFSSGAVVGAEGETASPGHAGTNVTGISQTQSLQQGRAVATTPKRSPTGAQVIPDPMVIHEPQAVHSAQTTQIPAEGNVGIGDLQEGGATGDVAEAISGLDLTELLPDAAVAGVVVKRPTPPPALPEGDEIADVIASWSTRRNWHKRVQEACDFYGDWPEALDAICGVESPKVAEQIRSRLASSTEA